MAKNNSKGMSTRTSRSERLMTRRNRQVVARYCKSLQSSLNFLWWGHNYWNAITFNKFTCCTRITCPSVHWDRGKDGKKETKQWQRHWRCDSEAIYSQLFCKVLRSPSQINRKCFYCKKKADSKTCMSPVVCLCTTQKPLFIHMREEAPHKPTKIYTHKIKQRDGESQHSHDWICDLRVLKWASNDIRVSCMWHCVSVCYTCLLHGRH